ncbi:hypothetical protein TNCV_1853611 [Trichonephila clavipes]|nr:hypothetical protein TNCV_1853611 [Trichonephila clavipes]
MASCTAGVRIVLGIKEHEWHRVRQGENCFGHKGTRMASCTAGVRIVLGIKEHEWHRVRQGNCVTHPLDNGEQIIIALFTRGGSAMMKPSGIRWGLSPPRSRVLDFYRLPPSPRLPMDISPDDRSISPPDMCSIFNAEV